MDVKSALVNVVILLLVALLLLNILTYLQQPGMVFFPLREIDARPADWGLDYEDVSLVSDDGVRLHGWYLPREGAQRVLLFLHGNAGNISHRGDSLKIFNQLGLNVLIIDYRGYGKSDGKPSEQGLYRDAQAAWRYLTEVRGFAPGEVLIFGRSLGGAVAAHLAARERPGALILESTFASADELAAHLMPLLSRLIHLRFAFDTEARLQEIICPLLMLHSPEDEIIPYASGRRAFAAASAPKRWFDLSGDHNSGFLVSQPEYQQALASFLASLDEPGD